MGVTHTFVSGIADDPAAAAAGQVLPSHWNATHTVNVNLASEVSGVLPVANGGNGTATPTLSAGSNVAVTGSWPSQTVAFSGILPVTNGGSGTATPSLVAGTNITVSGTWPNQTIDAASGGTPGGSTTQLQYNNAGAFGGASGLTTNGTELTIASGTKTADAPVVNATQTWNNAAITFTGLKFNATDTASNAASLLMDLQVGGTSKLKADKTGNVFSGGSVWVNGQTNSGINYTSFKTVLWHENSPRIVAATASVSLEPTDGFGWRNATGVTSTVDINLFRDAAGTLAQRNGTNAQTLRVYKSYTDASNYSRLAINNNQIASEVLGTGSLAITADTPLLNLAQTWNNAAVTFTGAKINVTDTASNAASLLLDLQVGGASKVSIDKTGKVQVPTINGQTTLNIGESTTGFGNYSGNGIDIATGGVNRVRMRAGDFRLRSDTIFGFASGDPNTTGLDVSLYRDAANTLAQRNGVNAQTFRVYNTYTSGTSYERIGLTWTSNVAYLAPEKGSGGGSDRLLVVSTGATTVAGLPSAATAGTGARSFVTDATATTFLSTVAGGGANKVPVVSDGTNWLIG